MNIYYKEAEELLKKTVADIKNMLDNDEEKIDCWKPSALDENIMKLIEARSKMKLGKMYEEKSTWSRAFPGISRSLALPGPILNIERG